MSVLCAALCRRTTILSDFPKITSKTFEVQHSTNVKLSIRLFYNIKSNMCEFLASFLCSFNHKLVFFLFLTIVLTPIITIRCAAVI